MTTTPQPSPQNEPVTATDSKRLDWLLDNSDVKPAATGWPFPDTRGTHGGRFVGRWYFEGCEGRPEQQFFKDRADIDAAMKSAPSSASDGRKET